LDKNIWKILGPLIGFILFFLTKQGLGNDAALVLMMTSWMAIWWVTQAVHIYATSLLPLAFLPLFGIVPMKELAPSYLKDIIFLFLGGFLISYAIEKHGLHKRISLNILSRFSKNKGQILFGFMFCSWFLSMWMMNTAVVAMLLPVILAVCKQFKEDKQLGTSLLLGTAFASSIGGMATLIGTAPNMISAEAINSSNLGIEVTFSSWMAMAMPYSILLFFVCFVVLYRIYLVSNNSLNRSTNFKADLQKLGKMDYEERWVAFIFASTAILWFTMKEIEIGNFNFKGWSYYLGIEETVKESSVAIFSALLLLIVPSKKKGENLIGVMEIQRLPIGIIFLFGSGFAIAEAFQFSGLNDAIAIWMNSFGDLSFIWVCLILVTFLVFFTEITSNTASINLFIPILIGLSSQFPGDELSLILSSTLAVSCAFMLPIATPPNAIVFASGQLESNEMMKTGFRLNILAILIITALIQILH
jgi:sodium-dependent dicarboxylate transporter 2/3/5